MKKMIFTAAMLFVLPMAHGGQAPENYPEGELGCRGKAPHIL
ncbi:MAG: hypothetical protein ACK5LE_04595 [Alphaproteobacteria bacterium]